MLRLLGLILVFVFLPASSGIFAQSDAYGITYLQNYINTDYNADNQNWAMVQAPNGLLYVGNTDGILEYDGAQWRIIRILSRSRVRSLAVSQQGWIYVGAAGEIGYIKPDGLGKMEYKSLIPHLPKSLQNLGEVWKTFVVDNKVYFQVEGKIIIIDVNTEKPTFKFIEPETSFHSMFTVNGKVYVRQRKIGLQRLEGGQLKLVRGGERFAQKGISDMVGLKNGKILVTTRLDGLFLYNGEQFEPFATPLLNLLVEHQVYDAERLSNGQIALGTLDFGIIIIDENGKLLKIINKTNGLNDNNVWFLFSDFENNLWACLESGIARIDITSPFTLYNETAGINGDVVCLTVHQQYLYIGTSQGVYYRPLNPTHPTNNRFSQVEDFFGRCHAFEHIGNNLYASNSDGIFLVRNFQAQRDYLCYAYCIRQLRSHPNILLVGLDNGLEVLDITRRPFFSKGKIENLTDEIREILEDNQGRIWLTTSVNGIIRLTLNDQNLLRPTVAHLGRDAGLPSLDQVFGLMLQGKPIFGTPNGIFEFDDNRNRFVRSSAFPDIPENHSVIRMAQDEKNAIWISGYRPAGSISSLNRRNNPTIPYLAKHIPGKNGIYKTTFANLSAANVSAISSILIPNDSLLWLAMPNGLARYHLSWRSDDSKGFRVMVRQIIMNDSVYAAGPQSVSSHIPAKEYLSLEASPTALGNLIIRFVFGATSYKNPQETRYQVWLENHDTDWCIWQRENYREYVGLPAGTYRFHVRALNAFGKMSQEVIYTFELKEPWYLRWWMFLVYTLTGGGLIYGIFLFAEYRSKKEKLILEEKVIQRTAQVMEQKEALERQNQAITDSIQYAKRIQQAILPENEYIAATFPKSFVYYRPREIVSGDFYWVLKKKDCCIVAIVDCTGHGVPGAFMSVLGNSLLDQIVKDHDEYQPAQILNQLNEAVITALKQKTDHSDLLDGMDIALLSFFPKNNQVIFAGANRPMIRIRAGELLEVRGDRRSIGGRQPLNQMIYFTQHSFDLQAGDRFYLYTDGISDQFGGPHKQKFFNKRVVEYIRQIQTHPIEEWEYDWDTILSEWKGNHRQTDDMLMIGIEW